MTASSAASNGCAAMPRLLPLADRSSDLYTIAFGLRNVTRIERALAEARRVLKPGGRFLCLEFTPAVTPLLQPLYDLYSFQFLPLARPDRHRRPRRLYLSRREHPAISGAERTVGADCGGRARAGQVPQSDRRHRRAAFGLAALTAAVGTQRGVRALSQRPQPRPSRPDRADAGAARRAVPARLAIAGIAPLLARHPAARGDATGPAAAPASGSPRR